MFVSSLVVTTTVASGSGSSATDWPARVVAAAGVVIAVLAFLRTSRESVWRRRASVVMSVRDSIVEVRERLAAAVSAPVGGAVGLWAVTTNSSLDEIDKVCSRLPDRRLRTLLGTLHRSTLAGRGLTAPDFAEASEGAVPQRTDAQIRALDAARTALGDIQRRLNVIEKKSGQNVAI